MNMIDDVETTIIDEDIYVDDNGREDIKEDIKKYKDGKLISE